MKEPSNVMVIDVFTFANGIHRVIDVPVEDLGDIRRYIEIKTGKIVEINENEISMKMTFCEFKPDINMHPDVKGLIVKHFG